ncbi:TonB-dependent receptor [Botryobacter ruber]|uniref:TonB-dependent receptor n=1 Tax=Botryobacter ruber TaxID=2171629 RepID=UPI000E0C337B|nr:TonB-dependent receptor [Botryobacter ruber]
MKKLCTLFALLVLVLQVQAQTGNIKGIVRTSDGEPAEFVNVGLKGTSLGATADKNGNYHFKNIQPGRYTLVATLVGLQPQEQLVVLLANETLEVNFTLQETAQKLQEVVISANSNKYRQPNLSSSLRLRTPVLETPQNIQVVTNAVLADQQVFDMLEGVTRNVSGVTRLEHWDNYARINMRGSQIAAFRNGMNVQMPWGPLAEDMSVVDRIEFVKGPAGFMMANGEPSGFYNIVTKKPTGLTKGEAAFTLGSFQTYRATLDLDGKLSSNGKLLYRLNLMGQQKGSHRDYEYNNRYTVAPVLKYLFSDNTSLTAEYTYQFSEMSAIGSNYAFSPNGYADLPRNFTTAEPTLAPTKIHDQSIFVTLQHQLDEDWQMTGQLAYLNYDQEGSSLWPTAFDEAKTGILKRGTSIWDALGQSKQGQFFVNGEVKTGFITHRLLAGVDMYHKDYFADWSQSFELVGTEPFNIYNPVYGKVPAASLPVFDRSSDLRSRGVRYNQGSAGIYVQDELRMFQDRLRVTLAARQTSAQTVNPYSGITNDKAFTPRVGVSYSINPAVSVYGLYDQAFVPQAGANFEGKSFDPITGSNTEAGIKKDWFNGTWNSTLAVYRITKNNVLTADPNNPNFSIQLGQTQTQGAEFDVRGNITKDLNLIFNYAYTDSKISKDTNPDRVGTAQPGISKHISNTWLSYQVPYAPLKGLGLSLGYQWQKDRSSWYVFDGTQNSLPDYFRLDGAVTWQKDKVRVSLNVNNLLDEYLYSGAPYGEYFYWQTEAGRNARLNVAYKF